MADTTAHSGEDTEKMLEDYKKDVAETDKDEYANLSSDEKTAWLRLIYAL